MMDRRKIETGGQTATMIKKTSKQILSLTALEMGAAIKAGELTAVEQYRLSWSRQKKQTAA